MDRVFRKNGPRSGQPSFTLVELLVVISIIGALAGIMAVTIPKAMEAGKKAKAKGELTAIVAAVKAYKQEYGRWPCRAQDYHATNTIVGMDLQLNWRMGKFFLEFWLERTFHFQVIPLL